MQYCQVQTPHKHRYFWAQKWQNFKILFGQNPVSSFWTEIILPFNVQELKLISSNKGTSVFGTTSISLCQSKLLEQKKLNYVTRVISSSHQKEDANFGSCEWPVWPDGQIISPLLGQLRQWKLATFGKMFATVSSKSCPILDKPSKDCQGVAKFCAIWSHWTYDQEHRDTKAFALIQPKMIVIVCSDDSDAAKLKGVEVYIQDHLLDRSQKTVNSRRCCLIISSPGW